VKTLTSPCFEIFSSITDLLPLHQQWREDFPFYLQSAISNPGSYQNARYDIIFAFPQESLTLEKSGVLSGTKSGYVSNDFLSELDSLWRAVSVNEKDEKQPDVPFTSGWFVYLGYELAGQIEPRLNLPEQLEDIPIAMACRIPAAIINDHLLGQTILVAENQQYLARLKDKYTSMSNQSSQSGLNQQPEITEEDEYLYLDSVRQVKQYIVEGDVFQVNLSRAWHAKVNETLDSSDIYINLRKTNPAPFAGIAQIRNTSIISSSPERLIKVKNRIAETRPIAGTRPRSQSEKDDAVLKKELMAHPKERSEHIMLIDLERNDLGRVCVPGTIKVTELMTLESYAHVHHIVSNIEGELRSDVTPGEVLRAVFPGGTITGCPKERCMAIIAELEGEGRGVYTGSMGYINHNGDMDFNILIRTITKSSNTIHIRAGAGLVADSDAQLELMETRHKARGMLLALKQTIDTEIR
jgi:anthranilate synthase component 1